MDVMGGDKRRVKKMTKIRGVFLGHGRDLRGLPHFSVVKKETFTNSVFDAIWSECEGYMTGKLKRKARRMREGSQWLPNRWSTVTRQVDWDRE